MTQKTPSMGVLAVLKISEGEVGSPAMRLIRGSEAAMDLALEEDVLRVRARMWIF